MSNNVFPIRVKTREDDWLERLERTPEWRELPSMMNDAREELARLRLAYNDKDVIELERVEAELTSTVYAIRVAIEAVPRWWHE